MPTAVSEREPSAAVGLPLVGLLRAAAPALAGYAVVRVLGVLVVLGWAARHGDSGLAKLGDYWDAFWYQSIARHGYGGTAPVPGPHGPYQAYAFFPLYPAVIRALAVVLPLRFAALAAAWAAGLVAAAGIFAVADRLYGRRVGVIATLLWGVVPYAVIESTAYSETLFTALAAWSVYFALVRRWVPAGVLCLLAGLTRPTGVALAAAIAGAAGWELARRRAGRPAVAGALLAPLGFLGYVGWVGLVKHRWDGYFRVQEAWRSHFDLGLTTLHHFKGLLVRADDFWLADAVVAAVLVASVLLFAISVLHRQPPVLLLHSAAMLTLALGDSGYFDSRARFLLPAVGLLLPPAVGLARLRSRASLALLLASAAAVSALYGGYVVFVLPDAS